MAQGKEEEEVVMKEMRKGNREGHEEIKKADLEEYEKGNER